MKGTEHFKQLLIVPYGIETDMKYFYFLPQLSFNCTLWN